MTLQAQTLQANEESQPIKAANWSEPSDGFTSMFYEKYRSQIWFSEEIALVQDMLDWKAMSEQERETYIRFSAGLNLLDTVQGELGMPTIHRMIDGSDRKATIQFQLSLIHI